MVYNEYIYAYCVYIQPVHNHQRCLFKPDFLTNIPFYQISNPAGRYFVLNIFNSAWCTGLHYIFLNA